MHNTLRRLLPATLLTLCTPHLLAADKELLDVLLGNGAITQEQYENLLAKPELRKSDVQDIKIQVGGGGIQAASADGLNEIKIGTRLHIQAASHDGDLPAGVDATDGSQFRRARIELGGKFLGDFAWAAEFDFAEDRVSAKEMKVGYVGLPNTTLFFGNQKQPYSLSVEMSANDIPFIERSVDNEIVMPLTDRAIGGRVDTWGEKWFFAAGVFGESTTANTRDDEGLGGAARFVYAPLIESDRVIHLGVRAAVRTPSASTDSFRFRDRTTNLSNLSIINTGDIGSIDKALLYGAEAAAAFGAFSVVGEYNTLALNREQVQDLDFRSWHVYATWSLTGETRASTYRIDAGEFKRINPAKAFSYKDGNWGAWELALRYAHLDVNDGSFTGGTESVLTSALNWYLNKNIRLMFEHSRILDTDEGNALRDAAEGLNIYQFRTQLAF
ncbi:MAG: hypothetical protein FJ194_13105 [Gammaproteobacteria bacterium]|nr:hypothetical protein [Gammaproteobacteria bacterium]